MIFSDALVEEIYQTLVKLPFASVETLIGKMRAEATKQPPAAPPPTVDHPLNGQTEPKHANLNKSKPAGA